MKKLTALLLAIVMTLSLVGCSSKPEISGTYQAEADLSELVIKTFDEGTALTGSAFSLKNYLTEFKVVIHFEFLEDGTYRISVDNGSIQTALQNLNTAATAMIEDYLFAALKEKYTAYGLTIETKDDAAALVNMSWDELCITALGSAPTEYVSKKISDSFAGVLTGQYRCEGRYTAEEGQLHISSGLEALPPEENYETYKISNGTVTFTGAVNLEDNLFFSYPYVLTPVSLATET